MSTLEKLQIIGNNVFNQTDVAAPYMPDSIAFFTRTDDTLAPVAASLGVSLHPNTPSGATTFTENFVTPKTLIPLRGTVLERVFNKRFGGVVADKSVPNPNHGVVGAAFETRTGNIAVQMAYRLDALNDRNIMSEAELLLAGVHEKMANANVLAPYINPGMRRVVAPNAVVAVMDVCGSGKIREQDDIRYRDALGHLFASAAVYSADTKMHLEGRGDGFVGSTELGVSAYHVANIEARVREVAADMHERVMPRSGILADNVRLLVGAGAINAVCTHGVGGISIARDGPIIDKLSSAETPAGLYVVSQAGDVSAMSRV